MLNQTTDQYDLFISYAAEDTAWVEGHLLDALSSSGVIYHIESAFELGVPNLTEFERSIKPSKRTLLVLSPAYVKDETNLFVDLLAQSYALDTRFF